MNRRTFFVNLASLIGVAAISSLGGKALAERKRGGSAPAAGGAPAIKLLDPNSAAAKGVNYSEVHSSVKEASLKVARQGVPFEKQNCKGCGFYSNPQPLDGKEVGNCQIFPGLCVKSDAWCSTWNKKA